MPKRRRRMGRVERKDRAFVMVDLPCEGAGRKMLKSALRLAAWSDKTTCHDVVVECVGPRGDRHSRLAARAICTSPKTKAAFEELAVGYAESVKEMLK